MGAPSVTIGERLRKEKEEEQLQIKIKEEQEAASRDQTSRDPNAQSYTGTIATVQPELKMPTAAPKAPAPGYTGPLMPIGEPKANPPPGPYAKARAEKQKEKERKLEELKKKKAEELEKATEQYNKMLRDVREEIKQLEEQEIHSDDEDMQQQTEARGSGSQGLQGAGKGSSIRDGARTELETRGEAGRSPSPQGSLPEEAFATRDRSASRKREREVEDEDMEQEIAAASAHEAIQSDEKLESFLVEVMHRLDRQKYKIEAHKKAIFEAKAQAAFIFAKYLEDDLKQAKKQAVIMGWKIHKPNGKEDVYNQLNHRHYNVEKIRKYLEIIPAHWPSPENISNQTYHDAMSPVTILTFQTQDFAKQFVQIANRWLKRGYQEEMDPEQADRSDGEDDNGVHLNATQDGFYLRTNNQDHMFGWEAPVWGWKNNGTLTVKAQISKGAKLKGVAMKAMAKTLEHTYGDLVGRLKLEWPQDAILEKSQFDNNVYDYIVFFSFRPKDAILRIYYSHKHVARNSDGFSEDFAEKVDIAMQDNDLDCRWMRNDSGENPNTHDRDDTKGGKEGGKKGKKGKKGGGKGGGKEADKPWFTEHDKGTRFPFRLSYEGVEDEEDAKKAWEEVYERHKEAIAKPIMSI